MAAVIWSGWVSQSRVEPSTSASSNVTVPVGNSPLTPSSLQSTSGRSARGSISLMLASMRPHPPQNISTNAYIGADGGRYEHARLGLRFPEKFGPDVQPDRQELFE